MLIANFERHFNARQFFPSFTIKYLDYSKPNSCSEHIKLQLKDQDVIVIAGIKSCQHIFGSESYDNSSAIDMYERYLFDWALELKIPLIGINRGFGIIGDRLGFDFRSVENGENHLNTYKNTVYAVNSHHLYSIRRSSTYTADVQDINGNYESLFVLKTKIFTVTWNPEMDDCPESGKDLFDILFKKYLGMER